MVTPSAEAVCPTALVVALVNAPVARRLAACVNVGAGVTSCYEWEGRPCEDGESTLIIKTSRARLDALTAAVKELHSYTVPEVIAFDLLEAGNQDYLAWVRQHVRGS